MREEITYEEAAKALDDCRQAMAEFRRTRLVTEAALGGVIKAAAPPEEMVRKLRAMRSPLEEKRAARDYRDFMQMAFGRKPTLQELRRGIPSLEEIQAAHASDDGMGFLPLLPLAVISGGAWGLSSIFGYLTERERTAQAELGIRQGPGLGDTIRAWSVPVVLALGVGALGYAWITRRKPPVHAVPSGRGVRNDALETHDVGELEEHVSDKETDDDLDENTD